MPGLTAAGFREIRQQVELSSVVTEAALLFEPVFFERGLRFTYEIESDIILYGNRAHLRQLTDILLDNAAKYASAGAAVTLHLVKKSSRRCLLAVSNEGEPIPEGELGNLFKRFYRGDKARTTDHSYGLGLSIAECIALEHHGRIRAESRDGYNTFLVELQDVCEKAH